MRLREERGLSLRALSERSGIPVGTLSWWTHHLRASASRTDFVAVKIRDDEDGRDPPSGCGASRLRMRLPSGVSLTVEGELAERVVAAVMEGMQRW
ncbi:MAG TPA: helix-turn-helix transcriptional regulator [Thauera aminoaromatica]|nr:helix-turn-helix transcriptional regulator [Thauera aminoaromatica]